MSDVKSEGAVADGKGTVHRQLGNGQILDLGKYRFSRALVEMARIARDWPPPTEIFVEGEFYQWTENGYFSEEGRKLTTEDF